MHTHRELCKIAASYLLNKGIHPFHKCQYAVCELERVGECPDAFGWVGGSTQLIEVKVSRSDFIADRKKIWRKHPHLGLGVFRSFLCTTGLINENELPGGWGLLYVSDNGKISVVKNPEYLNSSRADEIALITSILRREGIKRQVFSYKQYKMVEPITK